MTAIETSVANWFETTLSVGVGASDLTFNVGTVGTLTSPAYIVLDPDSSTKREVVLADGTWGASSFVTSDVSKRGLAGSASGAQAHDAGIKVRVVPLAQHVQDLHDRVDAGSDHGGLTGLADDDHTQYVPTDGSRAAEHLRISGAAASTRPLDFESAGSNRWKVQVNNTAEGGSNAGSDFEIEAYDDAGTAIDKPLTIARVASGLATWVRSLVAPSYKASGLTGAVAASRYVGATASGAPSTGTFAVGDYVIDQSGKVWVCTTAGSPGTFTDVAGSATSAPANDSADVDTIESTTSDTFTDLATAGPAVTVTTGTKALVVLTAKMRNSTSGFGGHMSFAVSGSTTVAATTDHALYHLSASADQEQGASYAYLIEGLTAGSNTFTAKYRREGGTAQFQFRHIAVIDMGS